MLCTWSLGVSAVIKRGLLNTWAKWSNNVKSHRDHYDAYDELHQLEDKYEKNSNDENLKIQPLAQKK